MPPPSLQITLPKSRIAEAGAPAEVAPSSTLRVPTRVANLVGSAVPSPVSAGGTMPMVIDPTSGAIAPPPERAPQALPPGANHYGPVPAAVTAPHTAPMATGAAVGAAPIRTGTAPSSPPARGSTAPAGTAALGGASEALPSDSQPRRTSAATLLIAGAIGGATLATVIVVGVMSGSTDASTPAPTTAAKASDRGSAAQTPDDGADARGRPEASPTAARDRGLSSEDALAADPATAETPPSAPVEVADARRPNVVGETTVQSPVAAEAESRTDEATATAPGLGAATEPEPLPGDADPAELAPPPEASGSAADPRHPPPGTPPKIAAAFARLPLGKSDGPPLGGIGASMIHVDSIELGRGYEAGRCTEPSDTFSIAARDRPSVCFRLVHHRNEEEVEVVWELEGRPAGRSRITVPARHAYRTRAYLRTPRVGAWVARIESSDGVELARRSFTVTE